MKNLLLILASVFLNASAQLFMRKGMLRIGPISFSFFSLTLIGKLCTNIYLILSIACYVLSALLWMAVLSKVDVSLAYPFLSIGFIIVLIMGHFLFGEQITWFKIVGIAFVCVGIFFLTKGNV
jgi:multidrug transporter EmrE-like cation transporter